MSNENYRILSIDASEIFKSIKTNTPLVYKIKTFNEVQEGYKKIVEKYKKDKRSLNDYYAALRRYRQSIRAFYKSFANSFDYSLDKIHLDSILKDDDKPFPDEDGNLYSLIIVNVTFDHTAIIDDKKYKTETIRNEIYKNDGFTLNDKKYKRFKRSCGSSREGSCLFIREDYYEEMTNWSNAGLDYKSRLNKANLASWEAYRALSLSSIEDTTYISRKGILFVDDSKPHVFTDKAISVSYENNEVKVKEGLCKIENNIWDGEALLDESLFVGTKYEKKSMYLLRSKFFKSCGFRCSIQKFFEDNNIKSISDLNKDCITFADNISDIVMIVAKSSLKFTKFMDGGFNRDNINKWLDNVSEEDGRILFGIVKHDKKQAFFDGRMVQTSYQFINTLHLDYNKCLELLANSINYAKQVWNNDNLTSLIYHFQKANRRDVIDYDSKDDEIKKRDDILIHVIKRNKDVVKMPYYSKRKYDNTDKFRDNLRNGNILIPGNYSTLFGNGPELLLYTINKFDGNKIMKDNTIYCKMFKQGETIIGARSPHITMGNILIRENDIENAFINTYFPNLTNEIVCVNAIGENIQQMLNGCDYDSDTILLTNDKIIVEAAKEFEGKFLVPVGCIASAKDDTTNKDLIKMLSDLDHISSHNKIGEIVNKSQKLNSKLWDEYNKTKVINKDIYKDICKLAIFSGVEIDSAKKTFEIKASKVIKDIDKIPYPKFFEDNYNDSVDKHIEDKEAKKNKKKGFDNESFLYDTSMEHVFVIPNEKIDLRSLDNDKDGDHPPYLSLFDLNIKGNISQSSKIKGEVIIDEIKYCAATLKQLNIKLQEYRRKDNKGMIDMIYEDMRKERERTINKVIIPNLLYGKKVANDTLLYILKQFNRKNNALDNRTIFTGLDLLFNIDEVFKLLKKNRVDKELVEDPDGDIKLYNFIFKEVDIKPHEKQQ